MLIMIMDLPFQEHHIRTGCGSVSVIVYGDQDKPALITYPDLALNCKCIMTLFGKIAHLSTYVQSIYNISTYV